jgi:hypothetical protein
MASNSGACLCLRLPLLDGGRIYSDGDRPGTKEKIRSETPTHLMALGVRHGLVSHHQQQLKLHLCRLVGHQTKRPKDPQHKTKSAVLRATMRRLLYGDRTDHFGCGVGYTDVGVLPGGIEGVFERLAFRDCRKLITPLFHRAES